MGVLMRKIYDLDSLIYEFKWHILNYILGLMEGSNYKVMTFFANNIQVTKLYD